MSKFTNLDFAGCSVRGIAYAGTLQVLEVQSILQDIRRVEGTSAGAITARWWRSICMRNIRTDNSRELPKFGS